MKPAIRSLLFGGAGTSSKTGDFGLAILRVGVGLLMGIGHGLGKIWMNGHFGVSDQFIAGVAEMGFPAPTLFAWCSALAEFLGGLLLAAGLYTGPAATFMAFNMCVAAFIAHRGAPIVATGGASKESALLYLLPALCFMFTGAGRLSADRVILGKKP